MSLETEVAALTQATTDLLDAVNIRKTQLDASLEAATAAESAAAGSAASANAKAVESAGSAAQALAIYGSASAQAAAVVAAQNAASLAAGHAATASSVVQQDLGGVNAAALHRSPNAVTAMFIYDTSKDSDGGAWTEKCQHTSWYNEEINGKWLGAQASEAAARAISGAAAGDYFQLTTDGKFYKLNAGAGITETFRGNKRDFPRLAAIVAELGSVTIYDLSERACPMWMRFGSSTGAALVWSGRGPSVVAVCGLNGIVPMGGSALLLVNFPSDTMRLGDGPRYILRGPELNINSVISRNINVGYSTGKSGYYLVFDNIQSLAMAVLPGASSDADTGLFEPNIAVATASGACVIRDGGKVVDLLAFGSRSRVVYDNRRHLWVSGGGNNWEIVQYDKSLGLLNNYQNYRNAIPVLFNNLGNDGGNQFPISAGPVNRIVTGTPGTITALRANDAARAKGITGFFNQRYNTGHLIGDIRRVYLSDSLAGALGPAVQKVVNGAFDADLSGWALDQSYASSTAEWVDGAALVTSGGSRALIKQSIQLDVGKTYAVSFEISSTVATAFRLLAAESFSSNILLNGDGITGSKTLPFTASQPVVYLYAGIAAIGPSGVSARVDKIYIEEAVVDRSSKSKLANIAGSLTKAPVAPGAQLVGYSGFSTVNYLQEPYSADLDFGVGEWSCSAWAAVPAGNASAGTIACREHSAGPYLRLSIDAANKFCVSVSDGTTTRAVTTPTAYATGAWVKVEGCYTTAGTLSIRINGGEVAATRGNPLLTINNANAVLTIGNSYALDAPFPGSLALLKLSATVPTGDQSAWMYEQEKHLFRDGAQCCLPDSGALVDMAYDDATDKWIAVSATNKSEWCGLVRTSVTPVPAGSYTKAVAGSGVQLVARSTSSPGVDVSIPAYGLREELVNRAEKAAKLARLPAVFDYVGGFTATTTSGSTAVSSVAGLSLPGSAVGAQVTGAGIPAGSVVDSVVSTTLYLSKAATANASAVQISFTDFALPVGYTAQSVTINGAAKTEGTTKDFIRMFDGFRETIRFSVAPGHTSAVQIIATRSAT